MITIVKFVYPFIKASSVSSSLPVEIATPNKFAADPGLFFEIKVGFLKNDIDFPKSLKDF